MSEANRICRKKNASDAVRFAHHILGNPRCDLRTSVLNSRIFHENKERHR